MEAQNWLSPSEAANRLNLSGQYVRKLMKQGKLTYVWTSLGRLIQPESIEAFRTTRPSGSRAGRQSIEITG